MSRNHPNYHSLNVKPPITEAGQVQIRARALVIQNTGGVTAYINTFFSIAPGATLQLAPFPDNGVIYDEWQISFATGPGAARLEIAEVQNNEIIC